ncbi:MAG: ATP-dependent endonuclease [Actinomycetota bacterium]|nr:ATP-dependent endonuclease [Actinomycetota bacterium]
MPEVVDARTVVLVEGVSDQLAVEALALRHGRDLAADGVAVLAMGGATNIGHYLRTYGPPGANVGLAGLCDEAEAGIFRRALQRAGVTPVGLAPTELAGAHPQPTEPTRKALASQRVFVCVADLEDELIRAHGVAAVQEILDAHGDLGSFRTFQRQPAQHGKSDAARLRRFLGTGSGRKIRYGALLVDALELDRIPAPLAALLNSF